jgi:hypothetical protein
LSVRRLHLEGGGVVTHTAIVTVFNAAGRRSVVIALGWALLIVAGSVGATMVVVGLFEELVAIIRGAANRMGSHR